LLDKPKELRKLIEEIEPEEPLKSMMSYMMEKRMIGDEHNRDDENKRILNEGF